MRWQDAPIIQPQDEQTYWQEDAPIIQPIRPDDAQDDEPQAADTANSQFLPEPSLRSPSVEIMGYSPAPHGYVPERSASVELVEPPAHGPEVSKLMASHHDVRQWLRKVETTSTTRTMSVSAHIRANTVQALAKALLALLAHRARRTRGAPTEPFQLPEDVEVCREAEVTAFAGIDCLLQV